MEEKLELNYLIIIALICEFCNKFLYSIFDTVVCQYGTQKHRMTALEFTLLSAAGSALNFLQTGPLFSWLFNTRQCSAPSIGTVAGLLGSSRLLLLLTRSSRLRTLSLRQPRCLRRGQCPPARGLRRVCPHHPHDLGGTVAGGGQR